MYVTKYDFVNKINILPAEEIEIDIGTANVRLDGGICYSMSTYTPGAGGTSYLLGIRDRGLVLLDFWVAASNLNPYYASDMETVVGEYSGIPIVGVDEQYTTEEQKDLFYKAWHTARALSRLKPGERTPAFSPEWGDRTIYVALGAWPEPGLAPHKKGHWPQTGFYGIGSLIGKDGQFYSTGLENLSLHELEVGG